MSTCHSGATGLKLDHEAGGWLCAPDDSHIVAMCQEHAYEVIREYAEKLGEQWTWASDWSGSHYAPMVAA